MDAVRINQRIDIPIVNDGFRNQSRLVGLSLPLSLFLLFRRGYIVCLEGCVIKRGGFVRGVKIKIMKFERTRKTCYIHRILISM